MWSHTCPVQPLVSRADSDRETDSTCCFFRLGPAYSALTQRISNQLSSPAVSTSAFSSGSGALQATAYRVSHAGSRSLKFASMNLQSSRYYDLSTDG